MELSCKQCGVKFSWQARGRTPKWCSPKCANRAWRRRNNAWAYVEQECEICGTRYMPNPKSSRYKTCSAACLKRHYYLRRRAELDEYRKQWSRDNPAKQRRYVLESINKKPEHYLKLRSMAERRRNSRLTGKHSANEWFLLVHFYGNKCLCCGSTTAKLTEDHVIPVSLGGTDNIDNIQPLCRKCNMAKGIKTTDYRPTKYLGIACK